MACSTCDGYCFVPDESDPDGPLVDCPDCHAAPATAAAHPSWAPDGHCPVHGDTVDSQGRCPSCLREVRDAMAIFTSRTLHDRAREVALEAA